MPRSEESKLWIKGEEGPLKKESLDRGPLEERNKQFRCRNPRLATLPANSQRSNDEGRAGPVRLEDSPSPFFEDGIMVTRKDKANIRYRQFVGGYAQALDSQLMAVLDGYQRGLLRRNEVRVFAALLEQSALHRDSKVSLYRIVNCQSQRRGNRRLTSGEIQTAIESLDRTLPQLQREYESERPATNKPVARKVLRHIARGSATTVEALFCFAYFLRRIPQRKPMQRLQSNEFYARLRYAEFEAWTGVHRATQSRILHRLVSRGYLNTAPVHKQNENCYGQLFIDGPLLSLVRPRQVTKHRAPLKKTSTPRQDSVNAPSKKTSTLRNLNPKTEIQEREELVQRLKEGVFGKHHDQDLQRIACRAAQMADELISQAA